MRKTYDVNPFLKKPAFGSLSLTIFFDISIEASLRREKHWRDKCDGARKFANYFPNDFRMINPSNYYLVDWKKQFNLSMQRIDYDDFSLAIAESDVEKINIIIEKKHESSFQLKDLLSYDLMFGFHDSLLSPNRPNYSEEVNNVIWELIKGKIKDNNLLAIYAMITYQTEAVVEKLMQSVTNVNASINADIEFEEDGEYSLLYMASKNGYYKIVAYLLRRNADVNGDAHNSPLCAACAYGHLEIVILLLNSGAIGNARPIYNPLNIACAYGHLDIVSLLLDRKVGVAVESLMTACEYGQTDVVRLMIKRGGINNPLERGIEMLHLACCNNVPELVSMILDLGVDVNGVWSGDYGTPLFSSLYSPLERHLDGRPNFTDQGRLEVVRLLLDRGAVINIQTKWGTTPLHNACLTSVPEFVRLLLDRGAIVNVAKLDDGLTPLHWACMDSDVDLEVVRLLLDRRADLNAQGSDGHTPLYFACRDGKSEIASLLLDWGAMLTRDILDAACLACDKGFPEMISFVLDRQAYLYCTKLSDQKTTQKTKIFLLQKCIEKMAVSDPPEGAEFRETLRELYTSVITPLCENDADLLLLLAIITQQPAMKFLELSL